MVVSHLDELVLPYPFRIVCQAFTLRYPNPFSPHVITADTIVRNWDPETGILSSTRLLLKRGTLPKWAPRGIIEKSETWVVEESSINILDKSMTLSNRNIDHRRVMDMYEQVALHARGEVTNFTGLTQVTSSWGLYVVRRKIEQYGIGRFQRQSTNSKRGLELIIKLLQSNSPLREPLLNAENINYPAFLAPSSSLKSRLRELRSRAKEKQKILSEMLWSGNKKGPNQLRKSSDDDFDHEEEYLTPEEEAELKQLEQVFKSDSSSVAQSPPSTMHDRLKSRWFWWWRWHCGTASSQAQKSDSCCNQSGPASHQ